MNLDPTTVLYAEDMVEDIFLMERAFQMSRSPLRLKTLMTGQEAIRYLSGKGSYSNREQYPLPFLILLDLKMPGMNGLEVLQWIRMQSKLQHVLVYVLSSSLRDRQDALQLGANDYWVKQTNFGVLMRMVRGLISIIPKGAESTVYPAPRGGIPSASRQTIAMQSS
jgi:CheY-like chemotaxis protein